MLSAALLYAAEQEPETVQKANLGPSWLVESLTQVSQTRTLRESLIVSRRNLVDMSTLCAAFLLVQVFASWSYEWWTRSSDTPEGERTSVPRDEARRSVLALGFMLCATIGALALKMSFEAFRSGIWQSEYGSTQCLDPIN